jgi:homoserine dehydrogenase
LGNVGRAFVRLLLAKRDQLRAQYGIEWRLTGVASRRMGWLANPEGLSPESLLRGEIPNEAQRCPDLKHWLSVAQPTALFEASSLARTSGEPAISHLRAALQHGAHAITANKGPVLYAYDDLQKLAEHAGRRFLFESTVMDGAPVFNLFRETLPLSSVRGFRGVLNSTTNIVLEEIERGADLRAAVEKAQALGIAETDPSDDLEGFDAAIKVAILVRVLMGCPLRLEEVEREGILGLEEEEIRRARAGGAPYKLVAEAHRVSEWVKASVRPCRVSESSPLAQARGTSSVVHFELEEFFGLTLVETNPGPEATAYGMLVDFIRAVSAC